MDDQRRLFRSLKPVCVSTSEAALQYQSGRPTHTELVASLKVLVAILQTATNEGDSHLIDSKLAEYVFFPLSHVFRQREKVPLQAVELSLRCLHVLLSTAWRKDIASELGVQLMILLTFISSTSEGVLKTSSITDDLLRHDFACLSATIRSLTSSQNGRDTLTATKNIPTLGHTITSTLDAVVKLDIGDVSSEALDTLHAFVTGLDREVLATFLPGIVSALTRALTPSSTRRRPYKSLSNAINILSELFEKTLSDTLTFADIDAETTDPVSSSTSQCLSRAWLVATAGQIRLALANIVRQRKHNRPEVLVALQQLCVTVLHKCTANLAESAAMMLETLITLSHFQSQGNASSSLRLLLIDHPQFAEHIQNSLYNHFVALPRVMTSNNTTAKEAEIAQMSCMMETLDYNDLEVSVPEEQMVSAIFDSMSSSSHSSQNLQKISGRPLMITGQKSLSTLRILPEGSFPEARAVSEAEGVDERLIRKLLGTLSQSERGQKALRTCLDRLNVSTEAERLTYLWLALHLLQGRVSSAAMIDEFLSEDAVASEDVAQREELYAFAIAILSDVDFDTDNNEAQWKTKALAMDMVVLQASVLKESFRPELSDALYPLLHQLGSSSSQLQAHAMTALNDVALSTGYPSAQQLVVANNDYVVNGIGLKLSSFDLSPQVPRILSMLVRLCGAKILPYLDDLTDSIFEALEYYHGYNNLVGLLFQCLGSIVEEGARAAELRISSSSTKLHRVEPIEPTPLSGLALLLRQRREAGADSSRDGDDSHDAKESSDETPRRPWNEATEDEDEAARADQESTQPTEGKKMALSKPYQLIHRISVRAQHHLPSGNALIRSQLAHVLRTAMEYLAQDEDTFLPLIHTLWPVLVPRLHDEEVSVVVGTLEVIAKMAEGSGSFVRGRIADIWDDIRQIHRRAERGLTGKALENATNGRIDTESRVNLTTSKFVDLVPAIRGSTAGNDQSSNPSARSYQHESESGLNMTVVSSKPLNAASNTAAHADRDRNEESRAYAQGRYVSTTSLNLHRALDSFLVSLLTHVQVAAWIFDEIVSDMLVPYLTTTSTNAPWIDETLRQQAVEALKERNADAVWLVQLRHGLLSDEAAMVQEARPTNVEDAIDFARITVSG